MLDGQGRYAQSGTAGVGPEAVRVRLTRDIVNSRSGYFKTKVQLVHTGDLIERKGRTASQSSRGLQEILLQDSVEITEAWFSLISLGGSCLGQLSSLTGGWPLLLTIWDFYSPTAKEITEGG
jgi:hypothetical protein